MWRSLLSTSRNTVPCSFMKVNHEPLPNFNMPGSKAHLAVQMHFKYTILDGAKTERAECQRCSHYSKARNTTREEQHLQECRGYQTWLDAQKEKGIGPKIKRKRVL